MMNYPFTWNVSYGEIKQVYSDNLVVVIDRDGNDVLPTIKYK